MSDIKVAIVEDHKQLRESLSELIRFSPGFELVGVYPNPLNIVTYLKQDMPDVVLMDIQMPGMTGIEAVGVIKRELPNIKIIMQTVFEDNDKIFQSICAGANGYILKNTGTQKYLEAITEAYHGGAPLTPSIATKVLTLFRATPQQQQKEEYDLTDREKEILHYLVKGFSYKMIADSCSISYDTVRFHMKNIYSKLHVASMTEVVAKVIKSDLLNN
ncbi:MAG TPA: response regulator transcription factor [Flavobacteriales bacterium]|nr:response regulator transcription factor [Flavobacteriales bacterium]